MTPSTSREGATTWPIRAFDASEADYAGMIDVHNALWIGEPVTVVQMQHYDRVRDPKLFFQRAVVEAVGRIVGVATYGEPAWSLRPGKYHVEAEVHPDYQRRGIGTALYAHIMQQLATRTPAPNFYTSETREDFTGGIRFLEARGFRRVMRSPSSALDVAGFDPSRYAGVVERVKARGIAIRTMQELSQSDPQWQHKLYELDWACTQDEPLPDAPTQRPFDEWAKRTFDSPTFLPEAGFVAVDCAHPDGDLYVGLSELNKSLSDPTRLNTGFTAVLASHRRRGIATALKLCAIEFARQYGAKTIRTGNEENNPMYQINLRLGFQPEPAFLSYEKRLMND